MAERRVRKLGALAFAFDDREVRAIWRHVPEAPAVGSIEIDRRLLFSDDVLAPPEWDVQAETAWREYSISKVTVRPLTVDLRNLPTSGQIDKFLNGEPSLRLNKGFITLAQLRSTYAQDYRDMVWQRPDLVNLKTAIGEMRKVIGEVQFIHQERSAKNRAWSGRFVRHVAEAVGEGNQKYISLHVWSGLMTQLDQAGQLLAERQDLSRPRKFELALPVVVMVEGGTADAVRKFMAYEHRVMSGAGFAVKWLKGAKIAGGIAAGLATGGASLAAGAAVSGGYTFVQEGAQQLSEVGVGLRKELSPGELIGKAGVAAVITLIGGTLQNRFQAAMKTRLASIGVATPEIATAMAAAGTSSVYTTSIEAVLNNVVNGEPLPKSASAFAGLIVDEAIKSTVIEGITSPMSGRISSEVADWKAGKLKIFGISGSDGSRPADAATPVDAASLPEPAVRGLLTDGGGFDRVHHELDEGSGIGAELAPAERQQLTRRIEAHQMATAHQVAHLFEGRTATSDDGRAEVRFDGPEAQQRYEEATRYLDAKSPGWPQSTGIRLVSESTAASTNDQLPTDVDMAAAKFLSVYDDWASLRPSERIDRMMKIVNREVQATGAPPLLHVKKSKGSNDGFFNYNQWEVTIDSRLIYRDGVTIEQFAKFAELIVHETRHAKDWFRMARLDPAKADKVRLPDFVKVAANEANAGTRQAEEFGVNSLVRKHADAVYDSVVEHATARKYVLEELEVSTESLNKARDQLEATSRGTPDYYRALAEYEARLQTYRDAYYQYRVLPEEVLAWTAGGEVSTAIRRVARQLSLARGREQKALGGVRRAFEQIRRFHSDAEWKAGEHVKVLEQGKTKRMIDRWRRAKAKVKTIEDRLAKLAEAK